MKAGFLASMTAAVILLIANVALASSHPKVAPLDEYFGRLKLSPLGIENIIHDTNLRVKYDPDHADKYYSSLATAEDALDDWAHKYPADPWLPGRAYFMSHVFWAMHSQEGNAAADHCRQLLLQKYPQSHWALIAKQENAPIVVAAPAADAAPAAPVAPAVAPATGVKALAPAVKSPPVVKPGQ